MQSVKKWGLSACTMTTSKKSRQFFPTMCVIPLSLLAKKKNTFSTAACCESEATTSFCVNLHKAEGTVSDEEKLLSMTDQFMQNGVRLISSQDELIWKERK